MKSAVTRGGTVEDIYFENIAMDSIGTFLQINMNWNPSYSYSKLPEGYNEATLPAHWKKLLTKVDPTEKGIPVFKDVYISNINIKGAKVAINANGMEQSKLINYKLKNVAVTAESAGLIEHAKGWDFKNVKITADDKGKPVLKDATDMNIPL